jgi:hypothetical protein
MENEQLKAIKSKVAKGKVKNKRADEFEKSINKQERQMKSERASRVKKGGFKSEGDYFRNANPFKNYDK